MRVVICICPLALEDEQIERGETRGIEAKRPGPRRQWERKVGARPVDHRHKVIANPVHAAGRQITQRLSKGADITLASHHSGLNVIVHRHAFDHRPNQGCDAFARLFDQGLARGDGFNRPHLTNGNIVQGSDDSRRPRLADIIKTYRIVRPEPPPCLLHLDLCFRLFAYILENAMTEVAS